MVETNGVKVSPVVGQDWNEEILGRMPKQERSKRRVDRIMEFSRKAIERDGVYTLNLNNVAKEADVNVATVYQFFPTKNAVIARLALREFDENYDRINQAVKGCRSADDVRRVFADAFVAAYKKSNEAVFLRELWAIMEADRDLNLLNQKDDERLAKLFKDAYMQFEPEADEESLYKRALLLLGMAAFAIRTAIKQEPDEGAALVAEAVKLMIATAL